MTVFHPLIIVSWQLALYFVIIFFASLDINFALSQYIILIYLCYIVEQYFVWELIDGTWWKQS